MNIQTCTIENPMWKEIIIVTDLPNLDLSANKTKGLHWSKISAMRKSARAEGCKRALEAHSYQQNKTFAKVTNLKLELKVYHKQHNNKVVPDDDNFLSALKPYRDGIFDYLKVKFNLNDRMITLTIIDTMYRSEIHPRVEWCISERSGV